MFATVYRTRSKGVRLPTPNRPVAGRLVLGKRSDGDYLFLSAKLTLENDETWLLIPELLHAQVRKITHSGLVISGREVVPRRTNNKSNADYWQQTWWCLVHTNSTLDALDLLGNNV